MLLQEYKYDLTIETNFKFSSIIHTECINPIKKRAVVV